MLHWEEYWHDSQFKKLAEEYRQLYIEGTRPENDGFTTLNYKKQMYMLKCWMEDLYEMMPPDRVEKKIQSGEIEIAPLAFMRGRTFTNSFVIVDEAQNTTSIQMKMVLTRIGEGSRMVINGDLSQVDLPKGQISGLNESKKILSNIQDIKIIYLEANDVIRHPIVAKIIKAYDKFTKN